MSTFDRDPVLDPQRLDEIARLRLHEEDVDAMLETYVKQAAEEFKLPVSLVTIVLDGVQKYAAAEGLSGWLAETRSTPVEWSFCADSVRAGAPLTINNTTQVDRYKNNPMVTQEDIRCYAGAPLVSKNGHHLGTFCIAGYDSRAFTQAEMDRLKEYATLAMEQIEARVA